MQSAHDRAGVALYGCTTIVTFGQSNLTLCMDPLCRMLAEATAALRDGHRVYVNASKGAMIDCNQASAQTRRLQAQHAQHA